MSLSSEVSDRQSDVGDKKLGLHESLETLPNNRKGESEMSIGSVKLTSKVTKLAGS